MSANGISLPEELEYGTVTAMEYREYFPKLTLDNENKKALIAMSGGVDSSVAALIMKESGFECTGCTMKLYDNEDACVPKSRTCCSLKDVEDARGVAERLGMPYYVFNFSEDFKETVIRRFVESYENGLTPNPCIDCNRYMKFDKLFARAQILGCRYVVTGHYARIEEKDGRFFLKKSLNKEKDQSYVLYDMTQEKLAHTLFPLGNMRKEDVRRKAAENGFVNAQKPDSQDICFVPEGDYARVIEKHTGRASAPGNFVLTDGTVVGEHKGIIRYTIGQRRGLGISAPESLYVCAIDVGKNEVVLCTKDGLFSKSADADRVTWISGEVPEAPFDCRVKIRYRHAEQPARVTPVGADAIHIEFYEPQRAVTPGQAAVMYDGDVVIGGGTIVK